MKDFQIQLEKLRRDAAACALIRDLATDGPKRVSFDRLAVRLNSLADHVEQEMLMGDSNSRPSLANRAVWAREILAQVEGQLKGALRRLMVGDEERRPAMR